MTLYYDQDSNDECKFAGQYPTAADQNLLIESYGYSNNGKLALKLCRSNELPDLNAPALSNAQSAQAVEQIIRKMGLVELWRCINASATTCCKGDGSNLSY